MVAGRPVRGHAVGLEGQKEQVHCSLRFIVKHLMKKKFRERKFVKQDMF